MEKKTAHIPHLGANDTAATRGGDGNHARGGVGAGLPFPFKKPPNL